MERRMAEPERFANVRTDMALVCPYIVPLLSPPRAIEGGRDIMFEQTFKNIDDVLWKERDAPRNWTNTEQTSWMLFLKSLDVRLKIE